MPEAGFPITFHQVTSGMRARILFICLLAATLALCVESHHHGRHRTSHKAKEKDIVSEEAHKAAMVPTLGSPEEGRLDREEEEASSDTFGTGKDKGQAVLLSEEELLHLLKKEEEEASAAEEQTEEMIQAENKSHQDQESFEQEDVAPLDQDQGSTESTMATDYAGPPLQLLPGKVTVHSHDVQPKVGQEEVFHDNITPHQGAAGPQNSWNKSTGWRNEEKEVLEEDSQLDEPGHEANGKRRKLKNKPRTRKHSPQGEEKEEGQSQEAPEGGHNNNSSNNNNNSSSSNNSSNNNNNNSSSSNNNNSSSSNNSNSSNNNNNNNNNNSSSSSNNSSSSSSNNNNNSSSSSNSSSSRAQKAKRRRAGQRGPSVGLNPVQIRAKVDLYPSARPSPRPEAPPDLCDNFRCKRGKTCRMDADHQPSCVCQEPSQCPRSLNHLDPVCGTDNKTYNTSCELFATKCKLEGTKRGHRLHLDYTGPCKFIPPCVDTELVQFPLRMRDWLKNVLLQLYEHDAMSPGYLTSKQRFRVKKIFEDERRLHAGDHSAELLAQDFEKHYNTYIYPVHWQFAQLDQHPSDRLLSHSELAPLRVPLVPMEHCTSRFFQDCDADKDKQVSFTEWTSCFAIKKNDIDVNLLF
ncbi:SPARC-like protein 1 isoform X2 [Nerophis ophidion]|uniref:SPARC-like protein 1 isoform X2 n=1 Tax=Nerophis ophidion TaxID=159077 RepID=UPI002AE05841|nr:SPARC-like protein 1 isoform X2 [Nerophis ophidion]